MKQNDYKLKDNILYPIKKFFSWEDVIHLINKNNYLKKINNDINRNEGYYNQINRSKNLQ